MDLLTQVLLVVLGLGPDLQPPSTLINQIHLGTAPSYRELLFRAGVDLDGGLHPAIETVSNMAEEARDPDTDVPRPRSTSC